MNVLFSIFSLSIILPTVLLSLRYQVSTQHDRCCLSIQAHLCWHRRIHIAVVSAFPSDELASIMINT